jgi:hypothetical protein
MKRLLVTLGLTGIIFGAIAIGCGKSDVPPGEIWGKKSNGLIMKLTAQTNVETDGAFEVAVAIKNVSRNPVVLNEVSPENFACQFNITDKNNVNVQWFCAAKSAITPTAMSTTLNPQETYRIARRLDREGVFTPPLRPGMELKINAVYEIPQAAGEGNAWQGKLVSNDVTVGIIDNNWGETVNGLRCYLTRVPDMALVTEPILLEAVIENTDLTKPVLLHASSDNKKKPQIDIEIIGEDLKPVFKSQRVPYSSVDFVSLSPGEKITVVVIPFSQDLSKRVNSLNMKLLGYQKAVASDKKMKLSEITPGKYYINLFYNHLVEKGKKYPKNWNRGWVGAIKSNVVTVNLTGGVQKSNIQTTSQDTGDYIEIKPNTGKSKTIKDKKKVASIKKGLDSLKKLKKASKSKIKGTITVFTQFGPSAIYSYSASHLEKDDDPGVQYQIPEALKSSLPK